MKILLTNKLMHKMIFGLSCMIFTGLTFAINGPFQYRDQFDSVSYNNSDGTTDWSAETWDETGDDDSASSGGTLITGNRLRFNSGGATDTIQRSLDLENATTATLSFDWEFDGATEDCNDGTVGDEINVLIRAQSSDAFTQIGADICGEPDENSGTFSESIPSSFFTSTAEIQILADGFAGGTEFFFVENLNIVGDASVAATTINIGDTVWYDLDSDGNFDSNEVAIANVSLNLFANLTCTGPAIDNTVTNASGNYSFEPENTGDYCVQVVESSLPAIGYIATTGGFTQSVNAPSIGNYTDLDFGFEATSCLPVINFDTYPNGLDTVAGDIITDQFAPWGITVSATGGSGDAMIFDGNNPTGGDDDLGSPHESFGGPGVGVAGVFGAVGENRIPQNRLLIISEDGDQSDPDDNGPGGTMFFTFERDLNMDELLFLDFGDTLGVDAGEARFYDEFDVLVETASTLPSVGDNGLGGLTFTATGIRRIEVQFNQSGSMAKFAICPAIIRESAVGDLVWLDIDSDGVFDVGEPGLPNVSVSLYDAGPDGISGNSDDFLIGTTQTGSDGSYLFAGLVGSDYYVEVDETTLPSNDLTLSTGSTNPLTVFTLADNSENFDQDFPYSNDSSDNAIVGDLVWSDADADGIRDPGESGISGVTLDLIDVSNNMVVATTTTGADGQYLFTNVPPGEYIVEVTDTNTELTGYTLTTGPQSNPSPSEPFEVAAGDVLLTLDFGYDNNTLFSISDRVWLDSDNDGVFDGGENGIENVTVNLLNDNGVVIATALTDENGDFTFPGLEDGDYQIQVSDAYNELTNYQSTTTPAENGFLEVTLNSANINNISFGYNNSGTIGDTIWNDADGDGVQDDNEIGIAGVELTLYFDENNDGIFNGSDTIVNQTTTDALGYYIFEDLIGTDYVVFIDSLQAALTDYTQTADPDEVGICSTCDSQSGTSLNLGGSDLEQDFGYQNSALFDISGNVFEDLDADGIDDGVGEPGFESVTLSLIISGDDGIYGTADDVVLATTATDSAGDYIFPDLPDDDYRVEVTDNTNILNDYSLTSGLDQIDVTLAGVDITDVDFGYVRNSGTASIGDYVWIDSNADGVQDNNESGIQSVALNLYNPGPDGVIGGGDDILVATTATDVFGSYDFQGLDAGSYYVDVDDSTLPAGLTLSPTLSDPTSIISLSDGEDYNDADFGYSTQANTSILGDLVWADTDGDGIRDPGELGIAGVDLDLIGAGPDDIFGTGDDISLTTTTAANGSYLFTDLTPGMYTVTVDTSDVPVAYSSTPTNADVTYQVTTLGDDSFLHLDWGFTPNPATTGSIGDTIWLDTDSDGIEDAGEPGIENVTVNLIGAGNDGVFGNNDDEILATTVTNNQGYYIFSGIQPDDYQVEVSDTNGVLVGMNQTSPAIGSISLSADEDYETADFGYAPGPGSIG
ncbi:MAG: SdrD B-like domain-containing protein, partial [Marinicellaceae bacterium]